jgi:hypothetical protein
VNDVTVRLGLLEERRVMAGLGCRILPHQLQHLLLFVTAQGAGGRDAELSEWGRRRRGSAGNGGAPQAGGTQACQAGNQGDDYAQG